MLSVTLVPPAPKSQRATTPSVGNLVSVAQRGQGSSGVRDQQRGHTVGRQGRLGKNSSRSAADWRSDQYAGIAIAIGVP